MATGTSPSMKNLSIDEMGNLPVPLPALDEQKLIAAYLDRETARIDALIAARSACWRCWTKRRPHQPASSPAAST